MPLLVEESVVFGQVGFLGLVGQADEGGLLGEGGPLLLAAVLGVGKGESFGVLDVICGLLVVGLSVSVAVLVVIFRMVLGLVGDGDVVMGGFVFVLDGAGEVGVVVAGLGRLIEVELFVLLLELVEGFLVVDEGLLPVLGLDHPHFGFLVAHNLNYITINIKLVDLLPSP